MVTPGVPRLIANRLPRAIDREQRAELPDLASQRDTREDLGEKLGGRAVHDRIRRRDDEARTAPDDVCGRLERKSAGRRDVARVDVAPEVPLARVRIGPDRRELLVVAGAHDVGETKRDERYPRP